MNKIKKYIDKTWGYHLVIENGASIEAYSMSGNVGKYIEELQQENEELKKQLDYIRSGEYYNQLRFERDMLQHLVDTNSLSEMEIEWIDCTHRNTELLEQNEKLKKELAIHGNEGLDIIHELESEKEKFIKYLENEMIETKKQIKTELIVCEQSKRLQYLNGKLANLKKILEKVKSGKYESN